jgi:hypothetical protein
VGARRATHFLQVVASLDAERIDKHEFVEAMARSGGDLRSEAAAERKTDERQLVGTEALND